MNPVQLTGKLFNLLPWTLKALLVMWLFTGWVLGYLAGVLVGNVAIAVGQVGVLILLVALVSLRKEAPG